MFLSSFTAHRIAGFVVLGSKSPTLTRAIECGNAFWGSHLLGNADKTAVSARTWVMEEKTASKNEPLTGAPSKNPACEAVRREAEE
jgi:hypothetical protein